MKNALLAAALLLPLASAFAATPCVAPQVRSACCNYVIEDQLNKANVKYYAPDQYFATEEAAQTFVKNKYAKIAFLKPVNAPESGVAAGWHYDGGSHHSGIDYWLKTVTAGKDVTTPVTAIAAGRVVTVKWDNWFGNTVIIEHKAPTGDLYRSIYMHLRNGGHADLALAQKVTAPDPTKVDNWTKYIKFAKKGYNELYWGKDTDVLKVKVGDTVSAGQLIGTTGNTGAGGAGNGLDADGNPTDTVRANNHLHFMLSVHPPRSLDWTFIDPYGVYGEAKSGCYADRKTPAMPRFFMPFYPSFFGVPADDVDRFSYYWPQMGLPLQTLNVYYVGGDRRAVGAFDSHAPAVSPVDIEMNPQELTKKFNEYHAAGYRPRQISVLVDTGFPYFTVIWQKRTNESYYFWSELTDDEFNAKWKDLVEGQGYHLEDYFAYEVVGYKVRHAALFVKDNNNAFYFFRNMTQDQYVAKFNELQSKGFVQVSSNVIDLTNVGRRFAAIWRVMPGSWAAYANMGAAEFQQKFNDFTKAGFRWMKVQGYQAGQMFSATWAK